ncbi:MAG TPA: tRNA (adenosine(37)-N6)-threonylcarbamoyltransferase complex ATPase subunit type 1 TsaE [Longimicrobiales bacterium]
MAAEERDAAGVGPLELTEPELVAWGERIGATVAVPVVFALRGELGAGKSVLARAIARGAGVAGPMPSPTFNLVHRYAAARGVDIVHLDLYRLDDPDEVWELGWRELGSDAEIVLVEWPERAESLLPEDRWDIYLERPGQGDAEVGGVREVRVVRGVRRGDAPAVPDVPRGAGDAGGFGGVDA